MTLVQKNLILNSRKYKTLKINYQNNILKTALINSNFLIFYFDFLSIKTLKLLKDLIKKNKWNMFRIKKNTALHLFKNSSTINFKNIFKNNTFIITINSNDDFNLKNLTPLFEFKKIFLLGAWYKLKLYRPSEIKNLLNLTENSKKNTIFILKNLIFNLKLSLSLKKIN